MSAATYASSIPEFSDHTRKLHRNLLILCCVVLLVEWSGVSVDQAKVFDIAFRGVGQGVFRIGMLLLIGYSSTMYFLHAFWDVAGHRYNRLETWAINLASSKKQLADRILQIYSAPVEAREAWEKFLAEYRRLESEIGDIPRRMNFFQTFVRLEQRVEVSVAIAVVIAVLGTLASKWTC